MYRQVLRAINWLDHHQRDCMLQHGQFVPLRRTQQHKHHMPSKYYVVWVGRETGIFNKWSSAQLAVEGFPGAKFKSFATHAEAEQAYREGKSGAAYPRRRPAAPLSTSDATSPTVGRVEESEQLSAFDVRIYCDGACEPNPGPCGSGIAIYHNNQLSQLWYGLYNPLGTNNIAELNALHQALLMAQRETDAGKSVAVLSDSKYSLNCIGTWAPGWEKKGWKRKVEGDIKNLEIIKATYELYNTLKNQVTLTHVAGHAGIEGNELADRMAVLAAKSRQVELRLYEGDMDVGKLLRMQAG